MIKACFFTTSFYLNNQIFNINNKVTNLNDGIYGFYILKEKLKEKQIDLSTQDINLPNESEFIIYNGIPNIKNINLKNSKNYLLLFESEIIRHNDWNIDNHQCFKKIFTWNDNFIDNIKYIKFNIPNKIPENLDFNLLKKDKVCAMIAGHKFTSHPLELYTERLKAIRWFERHHLEDFDLYGMGWDTYCFKGALSALNRFTLLTKNIRPNYPSYKGTVEKKRDVYERYKFSICYENARDIPGYITEKIFDCFFAGCVPIYWGAPNVTDFIPEDAFIDKRKFNSYEELYDYLINMTDEEYLGYLDAIKNFIKSPKIYPFSAECFADTIISNIY